LVDVESCVDELLAQDGGAFFVAERLPLLGTAILPRIHSLLADPNVENGVRVLAALSGFAVGDRGPSVSTLFDEIEAGGEFAPLAARNMASEGVPGAGRAALDALASTELDDVDRIVMFLEAVRDAGLVLPESESVRLEASSSWQVVTAVREFFPR